MSVDDVILQDRHRLETAGGEALRAVASAGPQIRAELGLTDRDAIGRICAAGRPRAIVVAGAGGSVAPGEFLAACTGRGSPVPVSSVDGPALPGWIGPMDLVIAVSASGGSPETLELVAEAVRRRADVVAVGGPGPLADAVRAGRGQFLEVADDRVPARSRYLTWRLLVPLALLAQGLGLLPDGEFELGAAADELDDIAHSHGPRAAPLDGIAADIALAAAESLLLAWGTPGVPAVVARRLCRQLAESAGIPALPGQLPSVARTHARVLEQSWGPADDIFRDRIADPDPGPRPRLLLLTDEECDPLSSDLAHACDRVAGRSQGTLRLDGGAGPSLVRLARMTQVADLASVYAAAVMGADPTGTAAELHPHFGAGGH